MWTEPEQMFFATASKHKAQGNLLGALHIIDFLLLGIKSDPVKYAYVLGCRKAVVLHHLDQAAEAKTAFKEAERLAKASGALAIAAYIVADLASFEVGDEALIRINEALQLCEQAKAEGTPDLERTLEADTAYFTACKARLLHRSGSEVAKPLMARSRRRLKRYAHGRYPRYQDAYLDVLRWEFAMYQGQDSHKARLMRLWLAGAIVTEVLRQDKGDSSLRFVRERVRHILSQGNR